MWPTVTWSCPARAWVSRRSKYGSSSAARSTSCSPAAPTQPASHSAARSACGGAEPPGAGPDDHLGPRPPELRDGGGGRVRPQQAAGGGHPALVGVECGRHAGVERIRRGEVDATGDGKREQHRASGCGADAGQPRQLVAGHQVEQRGRGDEGRAGELVRVELGDVGPPRLDDDGGPVGGRAGEVGGGDREQIGVPVVHDPVLRPRQERRQPSAHRPGAAGEVVDHPAAGCRELPPDVLDEVAGAGGGVGRLAEVEPSGADPDLPRPSSRRPCQDAGRARTWWSTTGRATRAARARPGATAAAARRRRARLEALRRAQPGRRAGRAARAVSRRRRDRGPPAHPRPRPRRPAGRGPAPR